MSEHNQSRKFADKSAAIANETLQKGKAAVEQSVQAFEQSYSATVEKMRDYNLKMIDMAQANTVGVSSLLANSRPRSHRLISSNCGGHTPKSKPRCSTNRSRS